MDVLRDAILRIGGILFLLASGAPFAQQRPVVGQVLDGLGQPVAGASVQVIDANELVSLGSVLTIADGTFGLALLPGDYHFVADASGFVPRVHDGSPCTLALDCNLPSVVPLTLLPDGALEGVDFALEWIGGLSGSVGTTQGQALAGATVYVFDATSRALVRLGPNQSDGSYFFPLPPGSYLVGVQVAGYSGQLYDDVHCPLAVCSPDEATPVAVATGAISADVDFALFLVSTLSGRVTTEGGVALPGATVDAVTAQGSVVRSASSDAAGNFLLDMEPGAYIVAARASGHRTEMFDDASCMPNCYLGDATPVDLAEGGAVTAIDFALDPAAFLSGRVTLADGTTPVAGVTVFALQDGEIQGQFTTAANGAYYVVPLVGEVRLRTLNIAGLIDVAHPDLPCPYGLCDDEVGQPIPIIAGQNVANVDFSLSPGGSILGTVLNARGRRLDGSATLFDATGAMVATAAIRNSGYRFDGLPSMDYSLRFDAPGYVSERYDDLPCTAEDCDPLTAVAVDVVAPQQRSGIDASLEGEGPLEIAYLNDCLPSGCVVTRSLNGVDDAINDISSAGYGTLPGWNLGAEAFDALTECVKDAFVPYRISIVTENPGAVPHREAMVGGKPTDLRFPNGVLGAARFDCSHPDGFSNSISFTFSESHVGGSIADICRTVAHEIGHQFGLDHAFHAPDYMSYLDDPVKDFTDADVPCGTSSSVPCLCGAPSQNSDQQLRGILGITLDIFASGFEAVPAAKSWKSWPRDGAPRAPFVCGTLPATPLRPD